MRKQLLHYSAMYAKIAIGAIFYAIGIQFFTYPNSVITGGVTGIAMIINSLTGFPVGVGTIIMNVPLFAYAWKRLGLGFVISSLVGMALCSIFVDIFAMTGIVVTTNTLLGSIYGGVIKGFGMGLIYTTSATSGGVDIVAKFLRKKYPFINFGTLILCMDVVIVAAYAVIFKKYDSAMYTMICMYVGSQVIDLVLYGAVNSKVCYIITDESVAIKNAIVQQLHRGVTFLRGEGAWSGNEKNIILCVIKTRQIVELKNIVKSHDENAFMILSDSREVFGKGFTYIGDDN